MIFKILYSHACIVLYPCLNVWFLALIWFSLVSSVIMYLIYSIRINSNIKETRNKEAENLQTFMTFKFFFFTLVVSLLCHPQDLIFQQVHLKFDSTTLSLMFKLKINFFSAFFPPFFLFSVLFCFFFWVGGIIRNFQKHHLGQTVIFILHAFSNMLWRRDKWDSSIWLKTIEN